MDKSKLLAWIDEELDFLRPAIVAETADEHGEGWFGAFTAVKFRIEQGDFNG